MREMKEGANFSALERPAAKGKFNEKTRKSGIRKISDLFWNSIGKKIALVFLFSVVVLVFLIMFILLKSVHFNDKYNNLVNNVFRINEIRVNIISQPNKILNSCLAGDSLEEGAHLENAKAFLAFLDELKADLETDNRYFGNIGAVNSVRGPAEKYVAYIEEIYNKSADGKYPPADSEIQKIVKDMGVAGNQVSNNLSSLLTLELARSSDLQQEIAREFRQLIITSVVISALAVVISIFLFVIIISRISTSIKKLRTEFVYMAEGDLSREKVNITTNDEIGQLADKFNIMSDSLKNIISSVRKAALEINEVTEAVMKSTVENEKGSENIAFALENMSKSMDDQRTETNRVLDMMKDIQKISQDVTSKVSDISVNAANALEKAEIGNVKLSEYMVQLKDVNMTMEEVVRVSEAFVEQTHQMIIILNSIREISNQTNLLSLNASIEAARAGDTGKGFAVIADEIRKLSDSTEELVGQIAGIVNSIQVSLTEMKEKLANSLVELEKSNDMANVTMGSFRDIKDANDIECAMVMDIKRMMEELFKGIMNMAESMAQIENATNENTAVSQDISATVEEETANLEEVSGKMAFLENLTKNLESLVLKFKL
ncbi:MAG TPA: methyl-accepting chemotaxis protein [Clostridiaceae bacterium]|nr:methyl-accepting chemotaxis protein [Clostridiaceae bacterium]